MVLLCGRAVYVRGGTLFVRMSCSSSEPFKNIESLHFGKIFKILLSSDLILKMAVAEIGVICAFLHFSM